LNLQQRIDELEDENARLRAWIAALQARMEAARVALIPDRP